jgi:hypothetical protein
MGMVVVDGHIPLSLPEHDIEASMPQNERKPGAGGHRLCNECDGKRKG